MTDAEYKNAVKFFEGCEQKTLAALKEARQNPENNGKRIDELSAEAVELRQNIKIMKEVRDHE